jgi:RND family efflux transporter MFP subunit
MSFLSLLLSCKRKKEENQKKVDTREVPTVLVSNPTQHQFHVSLQISGIAKPNQQVKIFAMSRGMLHEIKADIGDFVKRGQILAILENPDLLIQKEKADAELKGKKSIYERLKGVYNKTPQLTTIAEVERTEADYESSKAEADGLQSQINFLQVRAPFSGVIINRFADKGAIIQSGLNNSNAVPLFELQDLQPIRLTIDVAETDMVLVDKKTKAEVTFPDLINSKYSANVSRIAYGMEETTKTMKVEIDLPNSDLKIRPGMYAKVEIQTGGHKNVLSVANEAIGNIKGQSFVFVVNNDIVKKVEIKTGLRDEKFTELLNAEIKSTDQIVVQGKEFCSNGASVKPKFQSSIQ